MLLLKQSVKSQSLLVCSALLLGIGLSGLSFAATENKDATAEGVVDASQTKCAGAIAAPAKLVLPIGKSTLINLPHTLSSRAIGNQSVVQTKLIAAKTLYILGTDIGSSNMILQSQNGDCAIVDITVTMDPDPLQQMLAEVLPDEKNIKVKAAADSLILTGTVEDALVASRATEVAEAYVRRQVRAINTNDPQNPQGQQQIGNQQAGQQNQANNQVGAGSPRIINMLSVTAQQQVMLEVKVAEISKTLLDKFGSQLSFGTTQGSWTYSILSNFLSNGNGGIGGIKSNGNRFGLDGQKDDALIKILAEPSIMAISGQEGSFLAGGTIFIPVAQGIAGGVGGAITLEEKQFGVGVKFTPTVLAGGKINLRVAPEVSELNRDGATISANGATGTAILPSFSVRKASTTVQLMDGQTFAIGGLIRNNTTTNIRAFPFLGEIPVLGALFRSTQFQKDKSELVFMVTPRLVKPLNSSDVRLPTDKYIEPERKDLFLKGTMEGQPKEATPNTAAPADSNKQPNGFDHQ